MANIEGQYAISQTSPGVLTTYPQYEGSGYIGLVSFSAPADDFNDGPTFWNREGVPTPWPSVLHDAFIQNDGTVENNCDFLGEESIDEEWSGAAAPRITYLLVTSSGNSENGMLDQLADFYNNFKNIRVISVSYGWQESQVSNTFELSLQTDLGDLQNDGQSVFSATGECSSACPGGSLPPVGVPAGEPSAIAVGGTVLAPNLLNWEYGSETAWNQDYGGVDSAYNRTEPDVSLNAGASYQTVIDGINQDDWGGTSFAAPIWAAIEADADQYLPTPVSAGPFPLTESAQQDAAAFHDVTTGSSGTLSATAGYDDVTGWGSPNSYELFNELKSLGY